MTTISFAPGLVPVLKHGDPSRPDYARLHPDSGSVSGGAAAAPLTPERVAEAFNGTYRTDTGLEFTLAANDLSGGDGGTITVKGEILVGDQVVGKWIRKVKGTTMYAESLNVGKTFAGNPLPDAEKYQGQGIALEVQKQTEKAARELGCTEIKVSAMSDGTAAWAQERFGYRFEEKPNLRGDSSPGREPRTDAERAIPKGGVGYIDGMREYRGEDGLLLGISHPDLGVPSVRSALASVEERFKSSDPEDWPTPAEVVSLGTGRRVSDDILQGRTLGEHLLSRGWSGVKSSDHVTKAANGYMRVVVEGVKDPVLKHGTHDQSDHGRRGSGSTTGKVLDPTNADDVREAFTGTIETRAGTVNVVVDSVDVFEFSTSVQGALIGPNGQYAGRWSRTITPEIKVMYNETLEIAEDSRKSGIGTEFQKHSERAALALGMEKINIKAADDGREAWATERFGFDFAGPPSEGLFRAKAVASKMKSSATVAKVTDLQSRFDGPEENWPKPHEILALRGDPSLRFFMGNQDLGQQILSYGWDGRKPADRVTKRVEPKMFYVTVESIYGTDGLMAKHGEHDQSTHGRRSSKHLKMTDDEIKSLYEGALTSNGVTVYPKVEEIKRPDGFVAVYGYLYSTDQTGEKYSFDEVGQFIRTYDPLTKTAKMEVLSIGANLWDQEYTPGSMKFRGKGLATEFHKRSERAALTMGATTIKVSAESDGTEAWASERFGYEFAKPPKGLNKDLLDSRFPSLRPDEGGNGWDEKAPYQTPFNARLAKEVDSLFTRFDGPRSQWPTPAELSRLGENDEKFGYRPTAVTTRDDAMGTFILRQGWEGQKPADRVTKQVDEQTIYLFVEGNADVGSGAVAKHGTGDQSPHGRRGDGPAERSDGFVTHEEYKKRAENHAADSGWMETRYGMDDLAAAASLKASVSQRIAERMDVPTQELISACFPDTTSGSGGFASDPTYIAWQQALTPTDRTRVYLEAGKIQVFQSRHKDENFPKSNITGGPISVPAGFSEAEGLVREAAVSNLVNAWAQTSNDTSVKSLSVQRAAEDVFKIKDATPWSGSSANSEEFRARLDTHYEKHKETFQKFVKAQYRETQEMFKDIGVTEIDIYRGEGGETFRKRGVDVPSGSSVEVTTTMRPLSSWASDFETAQSFATSDTAVILKTTIPVSRIVATPYTGNGCKNENEIMLMGGPVTSQVAGLTTPALRSKNAKEGLFKAALVVQIDQDDEASDWIKTLSWDLPTTPEGMEAFLGPDWLALMKPLPAWSAAPESLKVPPAAGVIAFAPGSKPVLKHGTHAQLSHGNRSKGIDRTEMPQIPKANREAFLAELTDSGISHKEEAVDPRDLRRTQRAIDPVNVGQMHAAMVAGTMKEGLPIIVSSDGKVLDGHHRWAAAAQLAGEVPGTTIKITRVDMKMEDLLARARKFNEEQGIAARSMGEVRPVSKHGLHDQSSHGNWAHGKGTGSHAGEAKMGPASPTDAHGNARTSVAGGFYEATEQELADYRRASGNVEGPVKLYAGPNGTGVTVMEPIKSKSKYTVGLTSEDIQVNLEMIGELQRISSAPGLQVIVEGAKFERENLPISTKGFVDTRDMDTIYLRPEALMGDIQTSSMMSVGDSVENKRRYSITHEYGHVVDRRSDEKSMDDFNEVINSQRGLITGSSRYAREGAFGEGTGLESPKPTGREMFAEAWTGWVMSKGWAAKNPGMVQFFAEKYEWDSQTGTAPMAKAKAKGRIYVDSFGPEGGWVLDSLPGEIATVAFAPGSKPVLKHGSHDQKDHGRRGGSEKADKPIVNDFTDSEGNLVNPIGMRDSDHPDEEITVIPSRANPLDGLNVISIYRNGEQAGVMRYEPYSGKVEWVNVEEKFRRQGVATRLWKTGKYVATQYPNMIEPKHSQSQTTEGAAWATVVKFYRSLEPILKHGTHDQKDHGRRFSGAVAPEVAAKAIRLVGEYGGLSIKMTDGSEPPDGYMVARNSSKFGIAVTADEFFGPRGAEHLATMVLKNRTVLGSGRAYLGVWHQTEVTNEDGSKTPLARKDQVVHLDVTDRIVGEARAVSLGRRRDQISIWDVVNTEEIQTGGKGADVEKHYGGGNPEAAVEDDGRRRSGVGERGSRAVGQTGRPAVAVVKFNPGLVPVLKHGTGDQSPHGRRGSGGVEAIPEDLQKIFDYAVGRVKPLNSDEQQIADDLLLDTSRGWASRNGYPADDAPHDGLSSATIYGGAVVRRAMDLRDQEEKWARTSDEDADKVKAVFDEWRENGQVMISVPSDYLDDILRDGVKNQFETGESGGMLHNDNRAVDEAAHHGIRPDTPGEGRPVYGYVGRPGGEHPIAVHNYGDVTLVLKDSVRGRTTVTLGDSLNTNTTPVPIDGKVTPRQVSDASAHTIFSDDFRVTANNGSKPLAKGAMYMEAQIMGGVRREDISRIVFGSNADIDVERGGVGMLANEMRPYGISVDVMDGN
jgi:GNAT superfamily N-acetyltransferase